MTLLRWLTFLLGSLTVTLTVLLFWIYFCLLTMVLFYNGFPSIGKFWLFCCPRLHWLFVKFKRGCLVSSYSLFQWRISLSLVLLVLLLNFVSGFVYIPHRKYQGKRHSSPWFSAACAAAIVHRNHFFGLYQQNKCSECKGKFRQASNRCKRVLEAAKLAYTNKTKESITSQKLGSGLLPVC